MTTEECVRKLAEALEPMPKEKGQVFGAPHYGASVSPIFWWQWVPKWTFSTWESVGVDNGEWRPVSPLTSADASERLLEAMASANILGVCRFGPEAFELEVMWLAPGETPDELKYHHGYRSALIVHAKLRHAIFLAALKWRNIPIPEELEK